MAKIGALLFGRGVVLKDPAVPVEERINMLGRLQQDLASTASDLKAIMEGISANSE